MVKLDIPWMDSPFLKHTRLIKSATDISKLKKAGVKVVDIDIQRGLAPDATIEGGTALPEPQHGETSGNKSTQIDATKSLEKELNLAYQLRSQIKSSINNINAKLERNLPIDVEEYSPLVNDTLSSLERNNQALLNLAHLSRKSQKLVDHTFSTFCLCLNLAIAGDLRAEETELLALAALLHDTGWLQLPLQLMGKRSGYSATERKLVMSHLDIAKKMLSASGVPEQVIRIISEHHEHMDGSGYPGAKSGEELHPLANLLAVVDNYDETVHQLTDKPGMIPTNALRRLYREADQGKFDPNQVAALINILGIYPVSSAVQLNSGEKGVVEQVFADAHLEPIIKIHYDKNNAPLKIPYNIDLRKKDGDIKIIERVLDPSNPSDDPDKKLVPSFEA